jgi:hypothetical protein
MTLNHRCCAYVVERGFVGLTIWVILILMCIVFRAWLLAISGWSLVVALHAFLSLDSRPICLWPARNIGGLSCVGGVLSCLGGCINHILVAMSLYSWIIVMTYVGSREAYLVGGRIVIVE